MSPILDALTLWLADYQLLAGALLLIALPGLALLRQPAQRQAAVRSALISLALLAGLCALPGWSLIHLLQDASNTSRSLATTPMSAAPATMPTNLLSPPLNNPIAPASANSPLHANANATAPPASTAPAAPNPTSLQTKLLAVYAAGSATIIVWLAVGAIMAHRLRRAATPAPAEWSALLHQISGSAAHVDILVSTKIATPLAIGVRRPAIILPATLLSPTREGEAPAEPGAAFTHTAAPATLASTLAHEWSHIQNGDLRALAASRLLLILLWPQPLYWLLRRTIRLDQETLADAAAAATAGRIAYAEQLLQWAKTEPAGVSPRSSRRTPRLAGAVGLWESPSQLKRRLAILLDERFTILREASRTWRYACGAATATLALGLSLITWQPPTQADDDNTLSKSAVSRDAAAERGAVDAAPTNEQPSVAKAVPTDAPPTTHRSQGLGQIVAVPVGPRLVPPESKPNVLHLTVVDERDRPLPSTLIDLYSAALDGGEARRISSTATNELGDAEFADPVVPEVIEQYLRDEAELGFPRRQYQLVTVLQRKGLATMITYHSPFEIALRGEPRILKVRPAAKLSGRVTDPQGNPLAGAKVTVGGWAGTLSIPGVNQAITDAEGRYEFADRPAFDAKKGREKANSFQTLAQANLKSDEKKKGLTPVDAADELNASDILVSHPDFAVTKVTGGDIPGTVDAQMLPAVAITGRVVRFESAEPAAGVTIMAHGRPPETPESFDDPAELAAVTFHSASTKTDADGSYRLANLPPGTYALWAQPAAGFYEKPEWLSRGISELKAESGAQSMQSPDMVIGPGGTIRGQLIDGRTGEPLTLDADGGFVRPFASIVDGSTMQHQPQHNVACTPDGAFEFQATPGKSRYGVFVKLDDSKFLSPVDYQSADDFHSDGEILEVQQGEQIDAKFVVYSMADLEAKRAVRQRAYDLFNQDKFAEAIVVLDEALAADPQRSSLLYLRAMALSRAGVAAKAIAAYDSLLKNQPQQPVFLNNLADILATSPNAADRDGQRAIELAERAVEIIRKQEQTRAVPQLLDTLASAYAEAGDFEKAVATMDEAIRLAPDKLKPALKEHRDLYQKKQPLRREPPKQP